MGGNHKCLICEQTKGPSYLYEVKIVGLELPASFWVCRSHFRIKVERV